MGMFHVQIKASKSRIGMGMSSMLEGIRHSFAGEKSSITVLQCLVLSNACNGTDHSWYAYQFALCG